MVRSRIRRSIAFFLLFVFTQSLITPTVTFALTSGPTAPEFSSFEPVDTTDMVNIGTGDLVYNLPLLEVPGPEGGYPISLSYHSGIRLNEEASWVGLGWTLNAGAINRTINGNPDDHSGAVRTVRDYDEGGERNKFSIGVGYPGANFGLSVSHDTNLGWGFGHSAGLDIPFKTGNAGVKAGLQIGYDPFSGSYGHVGISVANAKGITARVGVSTNFNTVAFNTGLSYKGLSGGATMSSMGVKGYGAVAGASFSQVNSNAGRITTDGTSMALPIIFPNGFALTLGYDYLRYYSDESSEVKVIGSLYANQTSGKNPDEWTFDSYALLDPDATGGVVVNNDPEKSRGGSFPAYDFYNVNAQGINGNIQPYIFDNGTLFRQNVKKSGSNSYVIKYNTVNGSFNFSKPVNFRFKNDFSNTKSFETTEMNLQHDGSVRFNNVVSTPTPPDGFNDATNHLAGSKHIEWFTNAQLNDDAYAAQHGIMNYHDYYFKSRSQNRRSDAWSRHSGADVSKQIGAFMVTNESGVSYHYALPVYSYDEYIHAEKLENENIFHEEKNPQPYAYTWLLTAITGPDFVDRNENGYVDENDWGYWVRFDYGTWATNFQWRNPGRGYHVDIDNETKMYSRGLKEIYYLNEISTRTHTAFFQKEVRLDAKSAVLPDEGNGTFYPQRREERDPRSGRPTVKFYKPQSQLKLSRIYIVENIEAIKLGLFDYRSDDAQIIGSGTRILGVTDRCLTNQFDGIVDKVRQASLRSIEFGTDYSLCPETENSFEVLYEDDELVTDTTKYQLQGKLTLNSLKFLGKGGADLLPATKFTYDKNPPYKRNFYDMWGFYKKDFRYAGHENLSRYVSNESAADVDAWNLTGVSSPFGASVKIEYESDSYSLPGLYTSYPFPLVAFTIGTNKPDYVRLYFDQRVRADLPYFFKKDDDIRFLAYQMLVYFDHASNNQCTVPGFDYHSAEYSTKVDGVYDEGYIEVHLPELYAIMKDYADKKDHSEVIDASNYEGPLKSFCPGAYNSVERIYSIQRTIAGNVMIDKPIGKVGGGVRVKSVSVVTDANNSHSTHYDYNQPGTNISSGTTSYEPTGLDIDNFNDSKGIFQSEEMAKAFATHNAAKLQKAKTDFYEKFHGNFSKLLAIAREVPSPTVLYKFVSVSESTKKDGQIFAVPGKKTFEFQTFDESLVSRTRIQSEAAPFPVRCLDSNGVPTPCEYYEDSPKPDRMPVQCFDQSGNPVGCDVKPSNIITPMTIKDYSSRVGAVKGVSVYGANDVLLTKTEYQYLHSGKTPEEFAEALRTSFANQGVVTQLFNESRSNAKVYSRKDEFPLVTLGKRSTDFKTGLIDESTTLAFDFYSGQPVKTVSTTSYGVRILSQTEPAYKSYPAMGLKVKNPGYKNMLTQTAATTIYKLDDKDLPAGLLSATVTTWSDQNILPESAMTQTGIWREKETHMWAADDALLADGTFDPQFFRSFDRTKSENAGWLKTSEVLRYDQFSHPIEATDISGATASVHMDPNNTVIIAAGGMASQDEIAYSGAEYMDGNSLVLGGVSRRDGNPSTIKAHTGKYSLLVPFGMTGFTFRIPAAKANKPFRASVWAYAPGESETQSELDKISIFYTVNGNTYRTTPKLQKNKAKSWYQLNIDILPNGENEIVVGVQNDSGRGIYFDDFRVMPAHATMTSYVYDQSTGELAYVLDNLNFYTRYEYDGLGRLIRISKEMLNFDFGDGKESFRADQILQENQYNYKKIQQ